jgi:hypothetical protein
LMNRPQHRMNNSKETRTHLNIPREMGCWPKRCGCKARGAVDMSISTSRVTPQPRFWAATLWDRAIFAHSGVACRGCDPVRAAASAGAADSAPFDVQRSRCAPSRKSRFAATSPGHFGMTKYCSSRLGRRREPVRAAASAGAAASAPTLRGNSQAPIALFVPRIMARRSVHKNSHRRTRVEY